MSVQIQPSATQITGETRIYEQFVSGDTITNAAWSVSPAGPVISGTVFTATSATCLFNAGVAGSYLLTVQLSCASGQILKGQVRITVQDTFV